MQGSRNGDNRARAAAGRQRITRPALPDFCSKMLRVNLFYKLHIGLFGEERVGFYQRAILAGHVACRAFAQTDAMWVAYGDRVGVKGFFSNNQFYLANCAWNAHVHHDLAIDAGARHETAYRLDLQRFFGRLAVFFHERSKDSETIAALFRFRTIAVEYAYSAVRLGR